VLKPFLLMTSSALTRLFLDNILSVSIKFGEKDMFAICVFSKADIRTNRQVDRHTPTQNLHICVYFVHFV
jgi:hypothetical protein